MQLHLLKRFAALDLLCEYAIPRREIGKKYPMPHKSKYKCGVMYACPYKKPTRNMARNCPRKQIGDNRNSADNCKIE